MTVQQWYVNDAWADIPLGRGRGPSARERYGRDASWVRRWSCYAQVMSVVAEHWGEREDAFEDMGDPQLRIYQDIVSLEQRSPRERGRYLCDSVIRPVLTELFEEKPQVFPDGKSREAVCAWYCAVEARRSWKEATRNWLAAIPRPARALGQPERTIKERMWARGLADPEGFPTQAAPGLRMITEMLDDKLRQYRRTQVPEDAKLLDKLLPASLAENVRRGSEQLAVRRAQYTPSVLENLGIDEHGQTDLMALALPRLLECIARQESMLLLGPTSSGKSRVGRIAVCHAITKARRRHGRAIVLLPTKALVSQAIAEWKEFLKDTPFHEEWRILPGSRDYPQNDEAIARGEFEVAVIIPEKLAGLMAGGMRLDGCDLIVVDELQNLADRDRGPRLEMLLTTIRANYPMPILGLSATLTTQAADDVRRWLKIGEEAVVRVTKRPVPLNMIVCDDRQVRQRRADQEEVVVSNHDLGSIVGTWREDPVLRGYLDRVSAYERALAIALTLLKNKQRPIRSVLCFVGSRQNAQELADAAQVVLDRDPEMGRVDPAAGPFAGRFRSKAADEETLGRHRAFFRFPQTTVRDSVEKSLRTGVGYHSARLEQGLRSVVETAFRDGIIRLLFATDTLKLGINLPADAVVVGSLTTPTGDRKKLVLNRDTVAQRLGRAGRLLLGNDSSPEGFGYLVIPQKAPKKGEVEFQETELTELAERMVPTEEGEPEIDRALRALSDVDAVYHHYIHSHYRDYTLEGASIVSRVDDRWFAGELLHWAVQQGLPFSLDELTARLNGLYQASLGAVTGAPPPDRTRVIDMLTSARLIGPFRPGTSEAAEPGLWVVTGLGRAISTSGLPFEDAAVVEQLVSEAAAGAGDLTLLWIAARSQHVRETMSWISIVPAAGDDSREREQRERVLRLAEVLGGEPDERQRLAHRLAYGAFVQDVPAADLVGTGIVAGRLRQLLTGPAENPELEAITALLRACVMLLWMSGCPLSRIEAAIETNTRVTGGRVQGPRQVAVHAADVRSLGENASYLFDAARELSGVRPQGTLFRRFEAMGEEVELGVPSVLAPLARLAMPATHRERIVHLVPYLRRITDTGIDDVSDIVDRYLTRPSRPPQDRGRARKILEFTLSGEERGEIRRQLERQEQSRHRGLRLSDDFRKFRVPGFSYYLFSEALDKLSGSNADGLPADVAVLLRAFGLVVQEDPLSGLLTATSPLEPDLECRMVIHTDDFGVRELAEARGRAEVVLACGRVSTGVRLAFPGSAHNPVVVQPAILLEALARITVLARQEGAVIEPVESAADSRSLIDEFLSGRDAGATTSDLEEGGESEEWSDLMTPAAEGEKGMEVVGHRLLRLLTAAPPLLGRSELNRLIAGLRVAAPPEQPEAGAMRVGEE